ncbi:hypothetical protein K1719_026141 [Acacia pycnantha]|nr:hypothetical protein K1719_026141 [Acacia pycnantha]
MPSSFSISQFFLSRLPGIEFSGKQKEHQSTVVFYSQFDTNQEKTDRHQIGAYPLHHYILSLVVQLYWANLFWQKSSNYSWLDSQQYMYENTFVIFC